MKGAIKSEVTNNTTLNIQFSATHLAVKFAVHSYIIIITLLPVCNNIYSSPIVTGYQYRLDLQSLL
jgi:hypothetical protein